MAAHKVLKKQCKKLLRKLEMDSSKRHGHGHGLGHLRNSPPSHSEKALMRTSLQVGGFEDNEKYFVTQLGFLKELVKISKKLGLKWEHPSTCVGELKKELSRLEEEFVENGRAIIPLLSASGLGILRIAVDESFPIPTYGRVLYLIVLECAPLSSETPSSKVVEFLREHKDKEKEAFNSPRDKENGETTKEHKNTHSEQKANNSPKEGLKRTMSRVFGDLWKSKNDRLKAKSPYGHVRGWVTRSYIVKHGDHLLQEQFVMQMIMQFQRIFEEEKIPIKLKPYQIMSFSNNSGLIEVVPNAFSIDKLKQMAQDFTTLAEFFKKEWPDPKEYNKARQTFVQSLAGYSLVCYFLQIKDRHNGNIMLDATGQLIHIDFGYLLARTIEFEKAPFKLTEEFVDVMGGYDSKFFKKYVELCVRGFLAVRKHYEKVLLLIEMTIVKSDTDSQVIPCLEKDSVLSSFRNRLYLECNEEQIRSLVVELIREARANWRTSIYDTYQRILNEIY